MHLLGLRTVKGKDTGYPAVNVVDERIGGYDGMMQVMERGHSRECHGFALRQLRRRVQEQSGVE